MIEFVAEVSSNHDRNLSRSIDFIDAAANAGCSDRRASCRERV